MAPKPKKTPADKAAEKKTAAEAEKSAKETAKTKKEGIYRLDQGESLP